MTNQMTGINLRIASVLVVAAIGAAASAQYNYYTSSGIGAPTSVSNNAVAAGIMGSNLGLWRPVENIGPTNIGGSTSGSAAISANGMYVGGSALGPDGKTEIGRYSVAAGTWTTYGGAGGYSGSTRSSCWGISADGSTPFGFGYGTYTGTGTGTYTGIRPISFTNGVMTDYSIIPNANSINRIQASNFDGTIVAGRARYLSGTSQLDGSFYWVNGVRHNILSTSGTYLGAPDRMSYDGATIAGSGASATTITVGTVMYRLPYVYSTITGTYETIDTVAGVNGNAIPADTIRIDGFLTGLTGDGNTAIGFFRRMSPSVQIDKTWGFIWRRGIGVQDFDSYAAANGIAASANYYHIPWSISADGNTIAGATMARVGAPTGTAFMMTTVPEPATIFAITAGAAALIRRRKK